MDAGVNTICFTASYAIALGLELARFWTRIRLRRVVQMGITVAGLVAHTWYLGRRVAEVPEAPLASQQDWYLLAAWLLAVIYLLAQIYYARSSMGLFLLPAVLGLIGASVFATDSPIASFQAPRTWAVVHAVCLVLGTVAVLLGFLAGLMYLIQSYRLKHHKLPGSNWLQLPSLEWLERTNSRALGAATLFVGGGFFAGVLTRLAQEGDQSFVPWSDPVVLSLAAMLLWLVAAEMFRLVYPAARQGRKVAYLTIAAFLFLLLVLVAVTLRDSLHMTAEAKNQADATQSESPEGGPR